jgi:peroxiredoxin
MFMKRIGRTKLFPLSLLLLPLFVVAAAGEPEIGKPAPAFTAIDSNGKTHSLVDYRGKVVVLEWTNHDCPYVRKHYGSGNMQALQAEAQDAGVVWLTIISSAPGKQGYVEPAEANRLTESRKAVPHAVLLEPDGDIGRAYGARTTPHMFVIDADGVLRYKGGIDDKPTSDPADIATANNYVRAALADIATGSEIRTAVSRPYGCSVKYGT